MKIKHKNIVLIGFYIMNAMNFSFLRF